MAFLPAIAMVATVASAGLGAMGAIQQGQAQAAQSKYQAQVARVNQHIQENNAIYERQKGDADAQAQDMANKSRMGALGAAQGASGFDMASVSSEDTRVSARALGRLDTLTVRNNAERKAHDIDIAAMNNGTQAQLYDAQGKTARQASYLSAATSILGGVTSVGDKWANYQKAGISPFG